MKLLIIDDSEDDQLLYRRCLQKDTATSYDILEAIDGEEGLRQIQKSSPHCVLLDYSLPGHNGIEVLKHIREEYPFVPVVMLTGQGNEAIAVQAIHEGAQNYITKSTITPETIQRVVHVATEHCAMEKRIHEQRTALEIFTRALAHDLKEPVRTIKSFLNLLMDDETFSDEGKEYARFIQNAADRMGALVDTVYFYTRLDGTPEEIVKQTCDVTVVLEEVKENITQLIQEHKAIITHDPLPQIDINRMHLIQVLQNLLCNAINHCDVEPRIHLSAIRQDDHWILKVADNGVGIAESHRKHIFEPFRRMNHKEDQQGLGLGLAICKKIVESYGGKIWYESEPGKGGTVFSFTLPPDAQESGFISTPTLEKRLAKTSLQTNKNTVARVMLVEDNEADIKLTQILLIQRGNLDCHLMVARDGLEALSMLQLEETAGNKTDLMLLDINMPGMDGFTLLERLRAEQALSKIPVVMCTTSTDDRDMKKAKSLGAVGYVNKPANLDKLKPILLQLPNLTLRQENDGHVLLRTA